MLSMKKFVTAMMFVAAILSTMAISAAAQATEEQAQAQVRQLDDHFASKATTQSFAIAQSAAAKARIVVTGGPGTVVNAAYAATFPNQQPLLISLEGGVGTCRLHNTYTGETWSNVTTPRTFAPTLDESADTLLIGGYITADCGNGAQTANLFVHLFNKYGMMAVGEGDATTGTAGNVAKRFYAVSFVASRTFTWSAPGGFPSSGTSDEIFNVAFPNGGIRDIEMTFGPAPDRDGHKFSTRLGFYSIGAPALSFSRDRTGITLAASDEADVMPGVLTLQVRYARSIQVFNLNIPGVTAGEKLRVDLPDGAESATITTSYTTDEESPCTWARKLPAMQRPSMPER